MSLLTGRYSASPESAFDFDIKRISAIGFSKYLQEVEESDLSDSPENNTGIYQKYNEFYQNLFREYYQKYIIKKLA